jgi:SagB-type dehydrogenase family enzyme
VTVQLSTSYLAGAVYADAPGDDDPAEAYHAASKLSPSTAAHAMRGALRLAESEDLRRSAARAVRRRAQHPALVLPDPTPLELPLGDALATRRSARTFGDDALGLADLAAVLRAGYGLTGALPVAGSPPQPLRAAPSGGALYPLELFVVATRVAGLQERIHQYDPLAGTLVRLPAPAAAALGVTPFADLTSEAAAVLVIAAVFWRSRFKYGLRAYRFTLLEAGHVAQNVLLACTALGLAAIPLGGFYDRRLDELLDLDGVDESSLYVICFGPPQELP